MNLQGRLQLCIGKNLVGLGPKLLKELEGKKSLRALQVGGDTTVTQTARRARQLELILPTLGLLAEHDNYLLSCFL